MKFEIYDEGDYDEQAKLVTSSLAPPAKEEIKVDLRRRTINGSMTNELLPDIVISK